MSTIVSSVILLLCAANLLGTPSMGMIDNKMLFLIFLAVLPWIPVRIKSLELPGGIKIEFHNSTVEGGPSKKNR